MTEFIYNNTKHANINHILSEFYCKYNLRVLFKNEIDFHSRSYSANELAKELRELIEICYQNLFYT